MSNTIYCTYLTIYSGNKLPPLYIGSTSVDKINNGYRGSVTSKKYKEIWLLELSNNPHLFETQILTTHETREEAFDEEVRYQIEHDVVRSPDYINMAVANLKYIFVDYDDLERNRKISEAHKGRKLSEEHKKKQSESLKGRKLSEEAKKNMSESQKKRYENPEARKKQSESQKGKKRGPYSEEARKNISEAMKKKYENPEARKKLSDSRKGKKRGPYKKKL